MKILVLFKYEKDIDLINNWDNEDFKQNLDYIKPIINSYDENSLELALKLKDSYKEFNLNLELQALTVDEGINKFQLNKLYALGVDKITQIKTTSNNLGETAKIIQTFILKNNFDLVFCGINGPIHNSMQLPYLLSAMLNYHCITDVTKIEYKENLIITSIDDFQEINEIVKEKTILVIKNYGDLYLRVPTLKDKLKTKNKEVQIIVEPKQEENIVNTYFEPFEAKVEMHQKEDLDVILREYFKL